MRLLKLINIEKEGKGVEYDDLPRSGYQLFFNILFQNFWKLIKLNLIFIIFCIPIITIPASITAMSRILCDMVERNYIILYKDYYNAFKKNYMRSSVFGLIISIIYALAFLGYRYFLPFQANTIIFILFGLINILLLIIIIMSTYIHIMIATIDQSLNLIVNNSFRLVFISLFRNIFTLIIVLLFTALIVFFYPATIIITLLIFFSFTGYIICFNSWMTIKKYVIK